MKNTKFKQRFSKTVSVLLAIILISFTGIFLNGCDYYEPLAETDWVDLGFYNANAGERLGCHPEAIHIIAHEVNGLPSEDYLYIEETDMHAASGRLCMSEKSEEPILRYIPIKIDIKIKNQDDKESIISISDTNIIVNLVTALRQESENTVEQSAVDTNAEFYFDLPCELSWSCAVERRGNGTIHLMRFDVATQSFLDYDVTEILSDVLDSETET